MQRLNGVQCNAQNDNVLVNEVELNGSANGGTPDPYGTVTSVPILRDPA